MSEAILTPDPVTPALPPVDAESSLADHESAFGRGRNPNPRELEPSAGGDKTSPETAEIAEDRDEKGRFRHRAASQKATPEDVEQINALTKELRAKEQELAKIRPGEDSDSPRIRALKRQIKALDVDLSELKPKAPARAEAPTPAPATDVAPAVGVAFTEPEPKPDEFAGRDDPYGDHLIAKMQWQARKDAHEQAQKRAASEAQAQMSARVSAYQARVNAFAAKTPDFHTVTQAFQQQNLPAVLLEALVTDDNGPAYVYYLAQHPEIADQIFESTEYRPVTPDLVARTQRRLKQHAQAVTTGSAAVARPTYTPPASPPNPVRTGPERTGDAVPGDDASLAEHERAFGAKRGRR